MKYGERLKAAREHAGLTQAELALRAKVGTQENVSKLERTDAEGSEFTVQYAKACGVRPEWLAMEDGPMLCEKPHMDDERIKHVLAVMQMLPDYAVDKMFKEVDEIAKLVSKARSNGTTSHG